MRSKKARRFRRDFFCVPNSSHRSILLQFDSAAMCHRSSNEGDTAPDLYAGISLGPFIEAAGNVSNGKQMIFGATEPTNRFAGREGSWMYGRMYGADWRAWIRS
jgi:hypothetical protein